MQVNTGKYDVLGGEGVNFLHYYKLLSNRMVDRMIAKHAGKNKVLWEAWFGAWRGERYVPTTLLTVKLRIIKNRETLVKLKKSFTLDCTEALENLKETLKEWDDCIERHFIAR
jgi:hypothetical protein